MDRAPVAPRALPSATPPPAPERRVATGELEEGFADLERRKKLVAALSGLNALVHERAARMGAVGLFVGVVVDDELVQSSSFGVQSLATQAPVTEKTLFRIASVTKPFTAAAVMTLRDQGKLRLDDPVDRYLPEMAGVVYPSRDSARITLRHLVTNTSGLPREGRLKIEKVEREITDAEVFGSLDGAKLVFEPGSQHLYSNLGYALLGHVVARVSGKSYREYVRDAVLAPMGLTSATWEPSASDAGRQAASYTLTGGKPVAGGPFQRLAAAEASGGLFLSGEELARFVARQLAAYPARGGEDPAPLPRATLREMHLPSHVFAIAVEASQPSQPWIAQGTAYSAAFGWYAWRTCDYPRAVHKDGYFDNHQADAFFLPDHGVGIVVLSNTGFIDVRGLRTAVLDLLVSSGGLSARTVVRAPVMDAALGRLLELQQRFDESKYRELVTERSQKAAPLADVQRELAGYQERHGDCARGSLIEYSATRARYKLACRRAQLQMDIRVEPSSGKIDGFMGFSSELPEIPGTRRTATRVLELFARWSKDADARLFDPGFLSAPERAQMADKYRKENSRCKVGKPVEQDGIGYQTFELECESGNLARIAVRLGDRDRVRGLYLLPKPRGACWPK